MVLDGAMGTMIQKYGLTEKDYRGEVFTSCDKELRGNNECLNLTRPDIIKAIHKEYIAAGADIIETNTFSANRISQTEYGCEGFARKMAYEGAKIAREAAKEAMDEGCGRKISGWFICQKCNNSMKSCVHPIDFSHLLWYNIKKDNWGSLPIFWRYL